MRAESNQMPADFEYDPAAGGVGYLTWDQFDRLGRAVDNAGKHVAWWRVAGHIKLGDPDEHRPRSSDPQIPLPATWLAAEEITRLLGVLNEWDTLEDAVNTLDGQFFAELLTREVETAMAKWPLADRPHGVKFFRCMACQMATLRYYPPSMRGEAIVPMAVKCTARECHAVMDETMFMRMAAVIEAEWKIRNERVRGLDSGGTSAGQGRSVVGHGVPVGEAGQGREVETGADSVPESA